MTHCEYAEKIMTTTDNSGVKSPVELLSLSHDEFVRTLGEFLAAGGHPAYRTRQVAEWVYRRMPDGFEAMKDLPRGLRADLNAAFVLHPLAEKDERVSVDGTRKYLWSGRSAGALESVIIPDGERVTYCVSTQAGCPVKCTFCATGYGGFQGQLSAGEIVDQVLSMRRRSGMAPTNVVFMGMGEPLLNFDELLRAIGILNHSAQVGLGARRVTVSTVGIPDRIRELGESFPQVKLALSLHAVRDDLRDELIPLNRQFPLSSVLEAVGDFATRAGKHVTFEYVVLPEVNDTRNDAHAVAAIATRIPSRVNLIGYNPFPGGPYRKPELRRVLKFRDWIREKTTAAVTIRRSRGDDIHGACGQLSLRAR